MQESVENWKNGMMEQWKTGNSPNIPTFHYSNTPKNKKGGVSSV
jgi:hypothetical protein